MPRKDEHPREDLAARAEIADGASALTQVTIRPCSSVPATNAWLARLNSGVGPAVPHQAALAALDSAREDAAPQNG